MAQVALVRRFAWNRFAISALVALTWSGCAGRRSSSHPAGAHAKDGAGFVFRLPPVADEAPASKKKPDGEEKAAWKVDAPPGPADEVRIDTDEGTWMSLDLSPDGKTIAFDLLGDIYTVPIEGGEARALTSGIAWDMQPRFSPDGRWLAFTSDRGGGDNVWVMPAEGGEPRAVTKEDFRLVNSPTWSPDGQFIAVRKHFTARRSLGSGEIWLYHLAGSKGLQLTEKPNDQKDVGEPAFSPDGRYLYFSQDTTPGKVFEYNKDPHAGIYTIRRVDLQDGYTEDFIGGPGGAIRPTPSPDGKSLAFVRRVGLKTALFVHEIETGAERRVWDGLDRDMQETWAIHGVYPSMAFTPDSRAVVLWAGGKIVKVDVTSGKTETIPFRVRDTREVRKAVRRPVEVHPDTFHTRMLRWVSVSPDGKSVVYQALGHLWIRSLPDGKPRRLTTEKDAFEFYPSWSRDGRSIVYVAWNDETLGSVRTVSSRGGRPRTVTDTPGHYVEPVFSPDGKHIVYRRARPGRLFSSRHARDTGLFVVPREGGRPSRITRSGHTPHFGADDHRVFFMDSEKAGDDEKQVLKSIELDGSDERTHVRSANATDFRVSPDGRWLAFQESFDAYLAPLPATGRPFEVGPKADGLPITRISRDAGEYLHWSGNGKRVFWSLGSELFVRDLSEVLPFLEGGPDEPPEPPARGVDIGFDVKSHRPEGKIALVGGRVVTMKGDEVIEDGTIVVDHDRIVAVGRTGDVAVPRDAYVLHVEGMTVVPGFVDVHAHGPQGSNGIIPQQNWLHYATLAFGVTTIHDPSNDTGTIFAASEMARAGEIVAPRIFSTGTILYGAKAPFKAVIDGLDDARRHLRRMKAVGAFSVKSYNQPRRDQRQQILAAARELGMMVVPEGGSLFQHNMTMVVDGHTGIEHALPVAKAYRDVIQLWSGTEVGYTPTLGVGYGGLWGENYWYAKTDVFEHPRLLAFVPPAVYEPRSRRRLLASDGDWNHFAVADLVKALLDAGVHVQLGAHGQREGLAAHWELWMFVQGGMTPHEALRCATLYGAQYLGFDRDLGSIEPGKLADFAVIEGDVLADIRQSDAVRYTVVGGRIFDAQTMNELGPRERRRRDFYWERPGG